MCSNFMLHEVIYQHSTGAGNLGILLGLFLLKLLCSNKTYFHFPNLVLQEVLHLENPDDDF